MRGRASVKPSRATSLIGLSVGILMVGLGLTMAVPLFGAFGLIWTLVAGIGVAYYAINFFSAEGVATEVVDFETTLGGDSAASAAHTPEQRLARLDDMRQKGLITAEEYAEQRRRILNTI